MSTNDKDYFARAMAIFSLIVAIASMCLQYYQQTKLQNENVNIILDDEFEFGDIILFAPDIPPGAGTGLNVIQIPCELFVSNVGQNKLSIIDYELSVGNVNGETIYGGIKGKIKNINWENENLPIVLEGGESRKFIMYIGLRTTTAAWDILKAKSTNNILPYKRALLYLNKEGYNLYGDKVVVDIHQYSPNRAVMYVVRAEKLPPKIWIELLTSRGNKFITSGSIRK